jgi:hypothetical protein
MVAANYARNGHLTGNFILAFLMAVKFESRRSSFPRRNRVPIGVLTAGEGGVAPGCDIASR